MTGWYPHVRGIARCTTCFLRLHGEPNLLRVLRDNGYFVWWGGKNDLVPAQFATIRTAMSNTAPRVRRKTHVDDRSGRDLAQEPGER